MVCRDCKDLAASSQNVALVQSVEMAEALAGKRAIEFARELSFFDVLIEGDFLHVI